MKNYKLIKICYYLICFCILLVLVGWFVWKFCLPMPTDVAVRGLTLNACKDIAKGLEDFFDISSGENVNLPDQKMVEFIYHLCKMGPVGTHLRSKLPMNWHHSVLDCNICLLRDWPQTEEPTLIGYAVPMEYYRDTKDDKKSNYCSFVITFTLTGSDIDVELRNCNSKDIYDVNELGKAHQVIYYLPQDKHLPIRALTLDACKEIAGILEGFFDLSGGESVSLSDRKMAEFINYSCKTGRVGAHLKLDLSKDWRRGLCDCYINLLRDWQRIKETALIGYAIPMEYYRIPKGDKERDYYSFVVTFTLTNSSIVVELRDLDSMDIYGWNEMQQRCQAVYYLPHGS